MAHIDIFVDEQPFALMENRRVGHVVIGTVHAAHADHLERRLAAHHMADLHGRCVCAEQLFRGFAFLVTIIGQIERIVLFARGVPLREIQRGEMVAVPVSDATLSRTVSLCSSKNIPLTNAARAVAKRVQDVTQQLVSSGAWPDVRLLT